MLGSTSWTAAFPELAFFVLGVMILFIPVGFAIGTEKSRGLFSKLMIGIGIGFAVGIGFIAAAELIIWVLVPALEAITDWGEDNPVPFLLSLALFCAGLLIWSFKMMRRQVVVRNAKIRQVDSGMNPDRLPEICAVAQIFQITPREAMERLRNSSPIAGVPPKS